LIAADAREVSEELVEGITRLEILQEGLHWNPSPDENQGPAHDLGVSVERQR